MHELRTGMVRLGASSLLKSWTKEEGGEEEGNPLMTEESL